MQDAPEIQKKSLNALNVIPKCPFQRCSDKDRKAGSVAQTRNWTTLKSKMTANDKYKI